MACIDVCNTEALETFGRKYTLDELFEIVRKDSAFYKASGGGVTIGGGEPSSQAEFTLELLRKCKENYIHTAVDTCGYTTNSKSVEVLREADLVLFDVKGMDTKEHIEATGVSNEIIHKNLEMLDSIDKPVIIRLPIVPRINDSDEELEVTAKFLSRFRCIERVDIMGYHEYGIVKHNQLGRRYTLVATPYSSERLDEIKRIFERYSLAAQLGG
jgi:pyruvate formate lyase activating enzyme